MTGFGIVGLGDPGAEGRHRLTPTAYQRQWCADNDHPGHTYNPWMRATWCICGDIKSDGNHVVMPKPTTCGGPLTDCLHSTTEPSPEEDEG